MSGRPLTVTFDLSHAPPLGPSIPVEYPGGMADTVCVEERLSVCERGGFAPLMQEVGCIVVVECH